MALGVEQHRARDDRRHPLDAELFQRGIGSWLHLRLRVAAVIPRPVGRGNSPLPSHASGSTAKWPIASICVPCAPGSPLTVSSPLKACRVPAIPTVGLYFSRSGTPNGDCGMVFERK